FGGGACGWAAARTCAGGGGGGGGAAAAGSSATNARTSGTAGRSRAATSNDIKAMTPSAVPWIPVDTRIGIAVVLGTCSTLLVNRSNMTSSALGIQHGNGCA